MTDERQTTGAKILNLLHELLDEVGNLDEKIEVLASGILGLEGEIRHMKDAADRTEYEVRELTKELDTITEHMPDLHEIVLDMQARERNEQRASMKPAF